SSGKIQRRSCKSGVEEGTLEVVAEWKHGEISDKRKKESDKTGKLKFTVTKNNLKEWLVNRISEMMQIKKESIDTGEPFAVYGMDSLKAVQLSGDLETLLEKELPSTLVYDYPNINSLSEFLSRDTDVKFNIEKEKKILKTSSDNNEPIAITGIGLRFPGAKNVNEFWNNLKNGIDSVKQIPEGRWNKNSLNNTTVTFGGFADDTDKFDPVFFGISPREAVQIDPQQRFALEVAWEAIEDAGINPESLAGKDVGVFMGICTYDYARYSAGRKELFDVYTGTGTSLSIAANRLSYFFDFRGPSLAIDTACSSSLVALHTACQSIRSGQSSMALAGGVNLLLAPDWNIVFTEADMLAPDGKCKTFDADADGYVRSEGCGIVLLKKLSDAVKDGDRIYSVILGSAINQDGRSNGLTAPNGPSQVAVVKSALLNADVKAGEVSYVETHGTGTPLGDPIEVNSLKEALSSERNKDEVLWIGSVKTNIGHLEAAAGIAGVIKTSLALHNHEIPRHLNFRKLNPEILIDGTPVRVADKNIEWKSRNRIAGVSSFGFGGTNAHVILANAPEPAHNVLKSKPHNIITISAKNKNTLNQLVSDYEKFLNENNGLKSEDVCYSANRRASHNHRLAIVCSDINDLKKEISNYRNSKESFDIIYGAAKPNHSPQIAFLFPGQGAQYIGMGKELYDTHPLFRKTINRCDEILRNYLDRSLLEVLFYEKDEALNPINETMYTQPALFAVEYALAQVWMSWGVKPAIMMGHSAGEYIASCLAGVFSLEDGLKLVTERGRLMETLTKDGEMYTVFADEKTTAEAIKGYEETVSVASINGPLKTVISGNKDSLAKILPAFDKSQTEYKKITVSIASHSPLMKTMIEEFRKVCNTVKYSPARIPVVSNITGEIVTDKIANADYWCEHIMSAVRFSDSIKACVNFGCDTFIDLGPKPTSIGMGQETVMDPKLNWLPSFKKNFTIWETMLQGLGKLFVNGLSPDWINFDKDFSHKLVSLPSYPFQKQRYWIDEAKGARPESFISSAAAVPKEDKISPVVDSRLLSASENEFIFNSFISVEDITYLKDHCVFDKVVIPGSLYIDIALTAGAEIIKNNSLKLSELVFHQALILSDSGSKNLQTIFSKTEKNKYKFEIFSLSGGENRHWKLHASGNIRADKSEFRQNEDISILKKEISNKVSVSSFYNRAKNTGIEYKNNFQALKEIQTNDKSALGLIQTDVKLNDIRYTINPVTLDTAFQTALALFLKNESSRAFIPIGIDKLITSGKCPDEIFSLVRINTESEKSPKKNKSKIHKADIELLTSGGEIFAEIKGLQLKEVSREEFLSSKDELKDWFYEISWIEQSKNISADESGINPGIKNLKTASDKSFSESVKENNLIQYRKGIEELDSLSLMYIIKAFEKAGIKAEKGNVFSLKDLNLSRQHIKLAGRLTEILSEKGLIKIKGDKTEYTVSTDTSVIEKTIESIKNNYPEVKAELNLLTKCGDKLSEVIQGKTDPLQLLFPDGDLTQTTELYRDSPGFRTMNTAVKDIVKKITDGLPSRRKIEILELGAGTGSTSSFLFEMLPKDRTHYSFTDISPAFFVKAKDKFRNYDFIEYRILNIEKDVVSQEFDENGFDIVIASNVIHATKDLKITTDNILKLLAPGGVLILNEVTEKKYWIDLTFGMIEGWWRFEDKKLRSSYPLLNNDSWKSFLEQSGFESSEISAPLNKKNISLSGQSLITALKPASLKPVRPEKHIIFFADGKSVKNISKHIKSSDKGFTLAGHSSSDDFRKISESVYEADFTKKENIAKVFKELSLEHKDNISIVFMNSHSGNIKNEDLEKLSEACCLSLLNIIQSVPSAGFKSAPSLEIVTHDSQFVREDDNMKGILYSSLWGLGKVILMEHPEFKCRLTDIDSMNDIKALIEEIKSDPEERYVAFRDGRRYVSRLERSKNFLTGNDTQFRTDENGSYLITGGLSGLGILTAKFLASKGAKHLVLTGRSGISEDSKEILNEILSMDADVKILKADVTVKEDLEKIFKEIKKSGFPLKGIIHSAGVLDDSIIMNQTKNKFDKVMAPKVLGAWNLHELSKKYELDFFVMYSSVASLLGSAGQSNHSSANSFLDALAHYRKSKGLPALSINWGVWSEIGSAAAKGADKQEKIAGLKNIKPAQGIKALEKALNLSTAQAGILPMDWNKFSAGNNNYFISDLIKRDLQKEGMQFTAAESGKDFISQLRAAPEEMHQELLTDYFRKVISGIMGLEPAELLPEQPLNSIGLDSLMAIELKNKVNIELGVDLNLVRYMEETNIIQLANELKEQLSGILHKSETFTDKLRNSPPERHNEMLTDYFKNLISGIMGLDPDELEPEQPLNTFGLDSLMAIELKNKVNIELGVDLNLVRYMEGTNILQLAGELKEQLSNVLIQKESFVNRLKNSPAEKHRQMLIDYFRNLISGIMGLEPEELDEDQPLNSVGLDSLMAIELKNKVNLELGVDLNLVRYMEETNILRLAEELNEQLSKILSADDQTGRSLNAKKNISEEDKARDLLANLDNLTEEELEQLLKEMN
ncbi:MAG: SDR family NAD(P)-dependent oxidoreductase, partial [Bacteroidetes bacterium]|nr:SDR family NAD(P)-dependent oxidoreductase [Bacteroidota bacterium]